MMPARVNTCPGSRMGGLAGAGRPVGWRAASTSHDKAAKTSHTSSLEPARTPNGYPLRGTESPCATTPMLSQGTQVTDPRRQRLRAQRADEQIRPALNR